MKKLTFKEVKQYFEDRDCELYETEYINSRTKMRYRCKCGNKKCKISFNAFKSGSRCMECSGNKKYTLKEVKKYFEDHDCELFETEYVDSKTKMKYRCKCGNKKCKITFNRFQQGGRCNKCAIKKRGDKKRFKFEDVKQYFEDRDCGLYETEYINSSTKMRYRCDCGNTKCKITFYSFKAGQRCRKCSGYEKFTFEEVEQYFKDRDCKLLATEYKNCLTPMEYECKCGNSDCKIRFNDFKQGIRCIECSGKKKLTFEDVKQYFEEHDCKLLATEYVNNKTLMKYECECENSDCKITFSRFKQGGRCKKCAIEKMTGENHPNYNPNLTDEEREKGRICSGLGKWKKDVREKDNDTCQICGEIEGVLCAHHIESYTPNKELRTVLSNGITLCEEHHKKFHKKYGYGNNTREQLEEFLIAEKQSISVLV